MIKAITVWQPWATLIAIGAKPYEFRGWQPPRAIVGQRIAIHAGARPMKREEIHALYKNLRNPGRWPTPCLNADLALPLLEKLLEAHKLEFPSLLPLSHIVCTANVGTPMSGARCAEEFGEQAANDSDREGTFNWGWPMLDVRQLEPPAPARGAQGIWNWSEV
jgi:hypothetical protein